MAAATSLLAIDGLPPLREVIRQHDLWADKALGQNFLLDLNITHKIAQLAAPLDGQTIVEIGPGPGGLTRALLMGGASHVIAVERDERCRPALEAIAAHYPGRLTLIFTDALEADWPSVISSHQSPRRIVANLPYSIATKLLIGWLETDPWPPWFDGLVLMFQKEVAERIVAKPGNKTYGRLSVISQWRTQPKIAFTLPPEAFTPPPKVASAVVTFLPIPEPAPACTVQMLGKVTAAAFGQRRKMLRQSLRQLVAHPALLLEAANINPETRSEQLTPMDFGRLALILGREHHATGQK